MPPPLDEANGLTIDALRKQGADRADPVRFRFLEALARRTAVHEGEVRRVLEGKLNQAVAAYAAKLRAFEAAAPPVRKATAVESPLGALLRHIDRGSPPPAELRALRHFRTTWARLSLDRQLSRSVASVPANPGPLNSQLLVLRTLQAMQEIAPGYLARFMGHVEALMYIESATTAPPRTEPRSARRNRPPHGPSAPPP
jgi:hypothetical protein